ncbi:MAG: DNA repair protein [Halomonadaceae bacterium]|nr:MAG: DNA repair protein [Halomonadaceae bacterium]
MQAVDLSAYHTAIFFMENGRVARQMRLSEFESLLDGYLGLSDLADQDVKAVLVLMEKTLVIRSLVFFSLYFDEEGRADSGWNLPVEALAMEGRRGPDLGNGPIQLVCRSQTPRPECKSLLWDPIMTPGSNDFQIVQKAVANNTLRLTAETPVKPPEAAIVVNPESSPSSPAMGAPGSTTEEREQHRQKLASLLRAQRLRIRTLKGQYREQTKLLRHEQRLEIQELRLQIQEQAQQAERALMVNEQLEQKLVRSKEELQVLQQQLSESLSQGANKDSLLAENVLLQEQLARREQELEKAQTGLQEVRSERDQLLALEPTEDSLLARVRDGDVFVVAYSPGAGHMTLPYSDIDRYFLSPERYVAERCNVTEAQYREWLVHYESPRCQHGGGCGEPLMRTSAPAEFRSGRDDRCEKHQETLLARQA